MNVSDAFILTLKLFFWSIEGLGFKVHTQCIKFHWETAWWTFYWYCCCRSATKKWGSNQLQKNVPILAVILVWWLLLLKPCCASLKITIDFLYNCNYNENCTITFFLSLNALIHLLTVIITSTVSYFLKLFIFKRKPWVSYEMNRLCLTLLFCL